MESLKIRKQDGNTVSCIMEIPDNPRGIVIAIHGFSSSKECSTYQMLFRRMPPAGYGVVGIDLPGHGFEESFQEELRIEGALNSIEAAEHYAAANYPGVKICYFASSFGAFLTGLYISSRPHTGRKAFFRSAAVNMPDLFVKKQPTTEDQQRLQELEEKGYFEANVETTKPVRITKGMYHDLETTDLFKMFHLKLYGENEVMMAHGAEDSVIDPNAARAFAKKFGIPIRFFENEGHSLTGAAEQVADMAIEFYLTDPAADVETIAGAMPALTRQGA